MILALQNGPLQSPEKENPRNAILQKFEEAGIGKRVFA